MKRPLLQILVAAGALIAVVAIWLAGEYVSDNDRFVVISTLATVVIFVFLVVAIATSGRRRQTSRRRRRAF